jgi:hypothetical protein
MRRGIVLVWMGLALAGAPPAQAADATKEGHGKDESSRSEPRDGAGADEATADVQGVPGGLYVPPPRAQVAYREGGGTRGSADLPKLRALVPDGHAAATASAQPVLYYWLSAPTDMKLVVTIVRGRPSEGAAPLFEREVPGKHPRGVSAFRLADTDVRLDPDAFYSWSVALVPDPAHRAKDVVAGGAVVRRAPAGALPGGDASAATVQALAHAGLWYDALDASQTLARGGDPSLRDALLGEVGLASVAAAEKAETK